VAPIYGAYEFIVQAILGGIGMSSLGTVTQANLSNPTALISIVLALLLWVYFVAIHRRFWSMPIWKATVLYLAASLISNQVGFFLMWYVGFYTARVLVAAGIVTI
jgi:hypothetical protein